METCIGVMGWPQSEFWGGTPLDLAAAIRGRRRVNQAFEEGTSDRTPSGHKWLTEEEQERMLAHLEEYERTH